jgi:transcriptional regulator with XRE-family HTH domain
MEAFLSASSDYKQNAAASCLRGPDTLAHALSQMCAERVGYQKDVAAKLGVSNAYVSALLTGRKALTSAQTNRLLDACGATEEERAAFNAWGARESGWRF